MLKVERIHDAWAPPAWKLQVSKGLPWTLFVIAFAGQQTWIIRFGVSRSKLAALLHIERADS